MTRRTARPILKFRPWIWARTTLYEYFCMSWATRVAAERTDHPPLAARLVGESFELAIKELAIKVLHTLIQGPTKQLRFGHRLSALLGDVPLLERMLRDLWGADLDFVIEIMDGECDPSQVRYGAGGGKATKPGRVIPSGYAETSDVWTSSTLTLYEELMSTLGQALWSNYPNGDRHGDPVERRIGLAPATGTQEDPRPMTREEEAALQQKRIDSTIWALILKAVNEEGTAPGIPYWGIIPMERLNDPDGTRFFVRARVSLNMVADVEVTKNGGGFSVGGVRIAGREDGTYRLAIYSALAVLPDRGERA